MSFFFGAGDEARTRSLHLGKVALYQMSYARVNIGYNTTAKPVCQQFFSKFLRWFFRANSKMNSDSRTG